ARKTWVTRLRKVSICKQKVSLTHAGRLSIFFQSLLDLLSISRQLLALCGGSPWTAASWPRALTPGPSSKGRGEVGGPYSRGRGERNNFEQLAQTVGLLGADDMAAFEFEEAIREGNLAGQVGLRDREPILLADAGFEEARARAFAAGLIEGLP